MNIDIPAELSPFVSEMIARGGYRDESELLVEGLRLLKSREQLRAEVNAGIAQLEAGEGVDGEEVFARLQDRAMRLKASDAE
jgi:antitoxin ParD1/3/4